MKDKPIATIYLIVGFLIFIFDHKVLYAKCSKSENLNVLNQEMYLKSQESYVKELTQKMENQFDEAGAQVVLLANVGQNLENERFEHPSTFYSEKSHKYMHTGLAYKNPSDSKWKVIHILNVHDACENLTDRSYVSKGHLSNFFKYPHYKMDILTQVPSQEMQEKLLQVILDNPEKFHSSKYNGIANPDSTLRQNSNQFILYLLAATKINSNDCKVAYKSGHSKMKLERYHSVSEDYIKAKFCSEALGFYPTTLVGGIARATVLTMIPRIKPNISFKDRKVGAYLTRSYPFTSAANVFDFLNRIDRRAANPEEIFPSRGSDITKGQIFSEFMSLNSANEPVEYGSTK